ncbi:phospholipase A and acyltransferase 3-like isoform X2 [Haliotis rufescens]|uniref:phospholipase A and acyltransferase 3-like isoform X2 n=1 Tax=Haliotis rufescens TaxID=6454 RepID=UPI00201F4537|nr:phospholipase A and acyltransferase 3-like isoform X2 [Haliotis rufescens]
MFTRKRKTTTKAQGTKKHNGETLTDAKGTKTHNEETLSQAKGTVTPEEALARTARIKQHNEETLAQATPGDMLKFDRGIYCHWALCIGEGRVIHLAGRDGDMNDNANDVKVREDSFWKVAGGDEVDVSNDKDDRWDPYPPDEIVERAKSRLDRVGYNLVLFNCEHFTSWCRYGKSQSDQVDQVAAAGARVFGGGVLQIYDIFKGLVNSS